MTEQHNQNWDSATLCPSQHLNSQPRVWSLQWGHLGTGLCPEHSQGSPNTGWFQKPLGFWQEIQGNLASAVPKVEVREGEFPGP